MKKLGIQLQKHSFLFMILGSCMVAICLVIIAMFLYYTSGAAQLDLSRPVFSNIREEAIKEQKIEPFPSSGIIDKATLQQFDTTFTKNIRAIEGIQPFSRDVISPQVLGIDE